MNNLTNTFTDHLINEQRLRKYDRGQIVLYEGDKPPYIFVIKSGAIKMYDIDENGNEKIIIVGGQGDMFPILYALDARKEVAKFYTTIAPSELYTIDKSIFTRELTQNHEFAQACLKWFANEMYYLTERMSSLEKSDIHKKVVSLLYYLSLKHSSVDKKGWHEVKFPVTQQLLADMAGVARESVNVVLSDIQTNGITRYGSNQSFKINQKLLRKLL